MTVAFHKDKWNEETLRKLGFNQKQIKAVMYVKQNDKITNKERQEINDCSRNTAANDLGDLIREPILKESGKKGAGSYHAIAQQIAHTAHRLNIICTIILLKTPKAPRRCHKDAKKERAHKRLKGLDGSRCIYQLID